jgi:hypothetical protein
MLHASNYIQSLYHDQFVRCVSQQIDHVGKQVINVAQNVIHFSSVRSRIRLAHQIDTSLEELENCSTFNVDGQIKRTI